MPLETCARLVAIAPTRLGEALHQNGHENVIDFAEQQDQARRKTKFLLVVYFFTTLIVSLLAMPLIGLIAAIVIGVANASDEKRRAAGKTSLNIGEMFSLDGPGLILLALGFGVTMLLILGASWWRYLQLRAGGRVVAEAIGGRLISTASRDPAERRVLNVVEEMALAAGMPVPPVYVMESQASINAFAAGRSPEDAVVGVTEGTMRRLSRDQLQGIVAHEFSHILNGDMRLNIRLIAMLHGLLAICVLGRIIFEIALRSGGGDSKKNNGLALIPIGLLLMLLGFLGWLAGRLIQSSVSRQREFLADASAVEFTRNPQGITDALRSIGGASAVGSGSRIKGGSVDEYRHMFFASSVASWAEGLMATHPPLETRIQRLDAQWDGTYLTPPPMESLEATANADAENARARSGERGRRFVEGVMGGVLGGGVAAASAMAHSGSYADGTGAADGMTHAAAAMSVEAVVGQIESSRAALMKLPTDLSGALHEPYEARLVIFALLVNGRNGPSEIELGTLASRLTAHEHRRTLEFVSQMAIDPVSVRAARMPMTQVALASLSAMSLEQFAKFKADARAIIDADGKIDLDEWLLERMVEQQLAARMGTPPHPREMRPLKGLARQCAVLLWTLAYVGTNNPEVAMAAARRGAAQLGLSELIALGPNDLKKDELGTALQTLSSTPELVRAKVMRACAAVIGSDGRVSDREGDLLQFLAQMLRTSLPASGAAA